MALGELVYLSCQRRRPRAERLGDGCNCDCEMYRRVILLATKLEATVEAKQARKLCHQHTQATIAVIEREQCLRKRFWRGARFPCCGERARERRTFVKTFARSLVATCNAAVAIVYSTASSFSISSFVCSSVALNLQSLACWLANAVADDPSFAAPVAATRRLRCPLQTERVDAAAPACGRPISGCRQRFAAAIAAVAQLKTWNSKLAGGKTHSRKPSGSQQQQASHKSATLVCNLSFSN